MKFISENIDWHATSQISNSLNKIPHGVRGFAPKYNSNNILL